MSVFLNEESWGIRKESEGDCSRHSKLQAGVGVFLAFLPLSVSDHLFFFPSEDANGVNTWAFREKNQWRFQ